MQQIVELEKENIPESIRTYLLEMKVKSSRTVEVGKLGMIDFGVGTYLYTGSGKQNLVSRVERHLAKEKKHHWHIDYLLTVTNVARAYFFPEEECHLAETLFNSFERVERVTGFGASDCACPGHLFKTENANVKEEVNSLFPEILCYEN